MRFSSPVTISDVSDRAARLLGKSVATPRWLDDILAGRAFFRGATLAAGAGQVSEIQLFNPVASGVTIVVHGIDNAISASANVSVYVFNTALATLVGTGFNLLSGGTAAKGEIRTATPAGPDGTLWATGICISNTFVRFVPEWFVVLDAGEGVLTRGDQSLTQYAIYEWIEF